MIHYDIAQNFVIDYGTSFPKNPRPGQLFCRTDLSNQQFQYDEVEQKWKALAFDGKLSVNASTNKDRPTPLTRSQLKAIGDSISASGNAGNLDAPLPIAVDGTYVDSDRIMSDDQANFASSDSSGLFDDGVFVGQNNQNTSNPVDVEPVVDSVFNEKGVFTKTFPCSTSVTTLIGTYSENNIELGNSSEGCPCIADGLCNEVTGFNVYTSKEDSSVPRSAYKLVWSKPAGSSETVWNYLIEAVNYPGIFVQPSGYSWTGTISPTYDQYSFAIASGYCPNGHPLKLNSLKGKTMYVENVETGCYKVVTVTANTLNTFVIDSTLDSRLYGNPMSVYIVEPSSNYATWRYNFRIVNDDGTPAADKNASSYEYLYYSNATKVQFRICAQSVYGQSVYTYTDGYKEATLSTAGKVTIDKDGMSEYCNIDSQGKATSVLYIPYKLPLADPSAPAPAPGETDTRAPASSWSSAQVYWADVSSVPSGAGVGKSYNLSGTTQPVEGVSGDYMVDGAYFLELPFQGNRTVEVAICSVSSDGVTCDPNSSNAETATYTLDGVTDPPDKVTNVSVSVPSGMPDTFEISFDPSPLATMYHVQYTTNPGFTEPSPVNSGIAIVTSPGSSFIYVPPGTATVGSTIRLILSGGKFQLRVVKSVEANVLYNGTTKDIIRFETAIMVPQGSYDCIVYADFDAGMGKFNVGDPYDFFEFVGKLERIRYQFRCPNSTLIFKIYAINQFGYSTPEYYLDPTSTTTYAVSGDTNPAPVVTSFSVVDNPFSDIYKKDKCLITLSWIKPEPIDNFSHVMVMASAPINAGAGIPAQEGYAGPGYYNYKVGEFWESGQTIVADANGDTVFFYAISVNNEGYYPDTWFADNRYVAASAVLDGSDSAPTKIAGVEADYFGGGTIAITWVDSTEYDVTKYEIEVQSSTGTAFTSYAIETFSVSSDTTYLQYTVSEAKSSHYFRAKVRAVDAVGNLGIWSDYCAYLRGWSSTSIETCSLPTNLNVTQYPVTNSGLTQMVWTVTWDNPSPLGNYGGSEVWLVNAADSSRAELKARVSIGFTNDSDIAFLMPVSNTSYKVGLFPFNIFGLVPDYSQCVLSDIALTPTPSGYSGSLTAPADFTIEDGIASLPFTCSLAPITIGSYLQTKLWAEVQLWASSSAGFTNPVKVQSYAIGSRVASTETFKDVVSKEALTAAGFSTNSSIYFKVKAIDNFGTESGLSAINSAKLVDVITTDAAVPSFSNTTTTVMGLISQEGSVAMGWIAPDVNADSLVGSQLKVQRLDSNNNVINTATKDYSEASSHEIVTTSKNYTYRISVRFQNSVGWSAWYGLKSEVDTYATYFEGVGVIGQDTSVVPSAYLNLSASKIENAIQFNFSVTDNPANNIKTAWGVDVYYGTSSDALNETYASYVTASSLSLSWGSGDNVVTVAGATPASDWVGKWVYFIHSNGYPVQRGITAVSGQTITLNVSIGYLGTATNGYVITPLWDRPNVTLRKLTESPEYAPFVAGKTYSFSDANFTSGQTVYGKCCIYNIHGMSYPKSMTALTIGNFRVKEAFDTAVAASGAAEDAQSAADAAQTAATNAQTSAIAANNLLADIANDNKLTAVEKQATKKEWDIIVSEKTKIDTEADTYSVSKTAYGNAYTALYNYITNNSLLSDLTTTTNITGSTFRSTFKTYYDARQDILNAIATAAKSLADNAQTTANNAQTAANNAQTSANTANSLLADIASDSKLTPVEKLATQKEWNIITGEKPKICTEADTFSVSKTAFETAFTTLSGYVTPLLAVPSGTSTITGSEFRGTFKSYYDERQEILNAISSKAKTLADNAQTSANSAQTAANNAQTAANAAQADADAAQALLDDIANDDKLTPVEKQITKKEWDVIVSEKTKIDSEADTYGVSKTAYGTAYTTLYNYITNNSLLANLATTTSITGSTFRTNFKNYYDARQDILNAISTAAKTLANTAQSTADTANTLATTVSTGTIDYRSNNAPNGTAPSVGELTASFNITGSLNLICPFTYTNNGTIKADAFLFKCVDSGDSSNPTYFTCLISTSSTSYCASLSGVKDLTNSSASLSVWVYPVKTTNTGMAAGTGSQYTSINYWALYGTSCILGSKRTQATWSFELSDGRVVAYAKGMEYAANTVYNSLVVGGGSESYGYLKLATASTDQAYVSTDRSYLNLASNDTGITQITSPRLSLTTNTSWSTLTSVSSHLHLDTSSSSYAIASNKTHYFNAGVRVSSGGFQVDLGDLIVTSGNIYAGSSVGLTGNYTISSGSVLTFKKGILTGVS